MTSLRTGLGNGVALAALVLALSLAFFCGLAAPAQAEAPWNVVQISTGTGAAMANATIADGYAAWVEQSGSTYSLYLRNLTSGTNTLVATQTTTGDPYIGDGYVVWGAGDGVYLYNIATGTPGSPEKISSLPGTGATVDGGYVVWNRTEAPYHESVWLYSIADDTTTLLSDRVAADVWARIEDGYVIWQSQTLTPHGWWLMLHDIQAGTTQKLDEIIYENCTNEDQGAYTEGGRVLWMAQDGSGYWQAYVYDLALGGDRVQITSGAYDHQCARISGDWVTYCRVTGTTPGSESDEVWLYNLVTQDSTRLCSTVSSAQYYVQDLRPHVDATGNVVWERSWQNLDPEEFTDSASEILFFSAVTGQTSCITPQYTLGNPPANLPMYSSIDAGKVVFWSQTDASISLATRALSYGVTYTSIRGIHRYQTAQMVSQAMFPGALPPGSGVVLAPGETFQEALCGAPLAAAYGGPVLLTPTLGLENGTRAELVRLAPNFVICIGLSDAIKTAVQDALPGAEVTTIRGNLGNVYDMSRKVANALETRLFDMSGMTAIVTSGTLFPDAIGVSPLACSQFWPIILTSAPTGLLHASAAATLTDLGITKVLKVGNYSTLPPGVTGVGNLSGVDRYATNRKVADWAEAYAGLRFTHTGFATGDKFPDALAAGPYLALDSGVLLLSPLFGPLPSVVGGAVTANQADVHHVTYVACIEPVVGQVKALLPDPPVVTGIGPCSGVAAGGTTVTITGTRFTGATNVRFGSTPATAFTVNSATQITATAPAGTGTVDVTVTGPTGTSATGLADRFRYIPLPVVTSLSPTSGTTLGGTQVTITGTGFSATTAVNFGATPAAHFSLDSATQITATSPAHVSGQVDVTVTTPGGTSATGGTGDDFTYDPSPVITSISPTWGPETGGTTVSIHGANFTGVNWVYFGDTPATGVTFVSDSQLTAWAPAHAAGPVHVSVETAAGTSAPVDADLFRFGSPQRYEQDDPLIAYAGTWITKPDALSSGGSYARASSVGAQITFAFTGTGVDLVAKTDPIFGLATITLDNATPVTIDLSSVTSGNQQTVWSSGSLSEGQHIVTIFCTGQLGAASIGTAIDIDALDIVGSLTDLPPHESRDGLLVFDGTSLTLGAGALPGNDYPSRVVATIANPSYGAWIKQNVAAGGQTVAQMAADAGTQIDVLYSDTYHHNICVVWEGCISIDRGYSAVQLHDELKAYCLARRAAGFKVVLLTVLPFGNNPANEATRTAANALIRADWADYADGLADIALDSRIGDDGDQNDTTYYDVDKWHPNDSGYAIVAGIAKTAIETLY